MADLVSVEFEIEKGKAWALAQLVKRIGWSEIRGCAVSDDEAEEMKDGLAVLAAALADAGANPR